jgi:hypothetical protein
MNRAHTDADELCLHTANLLCQGQGFGDPTGHQVGIQNTTAYLAPTQLSTWSMYKQNLDLF